MTRKEIRDRNLDCVDITFLWAFERYGYHYHYHVPDCKLVLFKANKLKRWSFAIANWDRTYEYWRRGRFTNKTITRTNLLRRQKLLRRREKRKRLDCIKSKIYFCSYEGEGKGFTQKKYANQILRGLLKKIFEQPGDIFCVEDNNKVHEKIDTWQNHGICDAVRLECHVYSIDWPP